MVHIIVTGPESSGKTTLARQIAVRLDACFVPEYPRGYLEAAGRRAVRGDFIHFASVNRQLVAAGLARQVRQGRLHPVVVQDTGAEVLRIWLDDKLGGGFPALETDQPRPDLLLLCHPDLPWVYDPLREDPHRREALFGHFRVLIESRGLQWAEISGFDESRLKIALQCVHAKFPDLLA